MRNEQNMNIIETISQLENGKKIRRKGWNNLTLISYSDYNFVYTLYLYDLVSNNYVSPYITYNFTVSDVLADDWEVVED